MNKLCNLAEQQKNQRALKTESRILKETQYGNLAENFSPISRKLVVNETTESLADVSKQTKSEDGNTQTPAIQNILGT